MSSKSAWVIMMRSRVLPGAKTTCSVRAPPSEKTMSVTCW